LANGHKRAALLAGIVVLAASGVVLLRRGTRESRPDVLLVTIDTLRADRLGCYGAAAAASPRIDALAASGVVFDNAACPMPVTRPSHFSMLTGLYPRQHGTVNNQGTLPESALTVAEIFAAAGYRTAAFVGVKLLGADSGVGQGFERLEGPPGVSWTADAVASRAMRWVTSSPEAREPFFLWVHLFDPHMPYAPPAEFAPEGTGTPEALPQVSWRGLEELAGRSGGDVSAGTLDRALSLYAGEIAFTDHWVGRLLDALDGRVGRPRAAVALTADHGECFDHGIYFEHSDCLYDGALKVPLVLRQTTGARRGERVTRQVENLDLAATLLEMADVPRPASFARGSLLARDEDAATGGRAFFQHPFYAEHAARNRLRRQDQIRSVAGQPVRPLRPGQDESGVRTAGWKYIRSGTAEELYDLRADPGEHRNLAAARADVREQMSAALAGWTGSHPLNARPGAPLNEELKETLRSLGYLQ
jgi:arylsulfatase A-like enzyme